MRTRSFVRFILIGLPLVAAAVWLIGLWQFVAEVAQLNPALINDELQPTDAIVALTGGSERIPVALHLLEAGKGHKLFVSGVHPGLTLERLLANQDVPPELRSCCIILGHVAETTFGNAAETQLWLTAEDYHSLRLVTANYHMPRSLLIFRSMMPDFEIVSYPVIPDSLELTGWWRHFGTLNLLVNEYNKYLWAHLRLVLFPDEPSS